MRSRAFPLLFRLLFLHVSIKTLFAFFLGFFRGNPRLLPHFRVRQVAVVDHDHVEPIGRLVRSDRFVQRRREFREDDGCSRHTRENRDKDTVSATNNNNNNANTRTRCEKKQSAYYSPSARVPSKSFVISPLGKYPKSPPFLFPVGHRLKRLANSSNPISNFGRIASFSASGSSHSITSSHSVRFWPHRMCDACTMSMPLDLMLSFAFARAKRIPPE